MFDTDDQSKEQQTPAIDNSLFADQLKEIVNEGGKQKYDDVNTALAALKSSQEFIPKLEGDNKTLREELDSLKAELSKRSSVEEVVSKLLNKEDTTQAQEPKDTPSSSSLNAESVEQILSSLLAKKEVETSSASNKETVKKAFIEKFGEKAAEKFSAIAQEAGMSAQDLENLAATTPALVLKLMPEVSKGPSVSTGGFNSSVFTAVDNGSGDIQPSTQSVLAGATAKDLRNEMSRHKEAVYKRLQVTT